MIRKNKFGVLSLILALLVLAAFQASAFSYTVEVLDNTITKEESAEFKVLVHNTGSYDDLFTISTKDVNWILSSASSIIPAGEETEFMVSLKPKPLMIEDRTYFIPVMITSEKTGFYYDDTKQFAVFIINPDRLPGVYPPTVTPTIAMAEKKIDPREKVSVIVRLWNRNPRELEGLRVVIEGEVFQKEYTTKLLPLEDKMNEILFEIYPLTEPGIRTLIVTIFFEDKNIAESSTQYEIIGYADLKETSSQDTVFCRTEKRLSIYNNGNQPGLAEKKFSINFLERLFTKFSPDAEKIKGEDGKTYYVVKATLKPKETLNMEVVTNYRVLVLIILIIIAGVILYYLLRSPLIIIKNAEPLGKGAEGLSELKVSIYLKNRSRKPLTNLRVVDVVPSIAEIERKTRLGSMEPVHIGTSHKGTIAKWELHALEPYEERIITYRLKSKLTLIGGIRLPSTKARFDAKQGKERVVYSNSINLIHGK